MWNTRASWLLKPARTFIGSLIIALSIAGASSAQILIGSPYVTGFEGWTDTYIPVETQIGPSPSWGVLLTPDPFSGQRFLFEAGGGTEGSGTTSPAPDNVADGMYKPYMMVNLADTTPADYTLTYQLATVDNDGFGLVFGYQDNDNYFRVGFREQSPGNQGFQEGTSVQKVVNGTITQLATSIGTANDFVPQSNGTPFEAKVVVNGSNWDVQVNNISVLSGSDSDLQPGHYGVHSWQQREVSSTDSPQYGSIFGPISVASTTLNKTTDFANAVSSVPWRRLTMLDGFGASGIVQADDHGNFAQDFTNGTIRDDSNGNANATAAAPNVDYIGPAIVVDGAPAAAMTDYRFTTRVENRDNDGIGVLFRVADDQNFYRATWTTEGTTGTARPLQGLTIQKYTNGFLWEAVPLDAGGTVFNDTRFLPADSVPFDLSVQVVGNQIKIDVIEDPDGTPINHSYDVITDNTGAILNGSVGLTNWGNGDGDNGAVYSAYNGNSQSLVSAITSFIDYGLIVDRDDGNVMFVNNATGTQGLKGLRIFSGNGAILDANWQSISDNYDEGGSVDNNDPWTELVQSEFELSERENSGGDGGSMTSGQMVNLGNIWQKSQIEDLSFVVELLDGNTIGGTVSFIDGPGGMSYNPADLNVDGDVTEADWELFYPNMLTDLSAMTGIQQALAGDLDLDGDNDVNDFIMFKTNFELLNGAGSFNQMVASVPEPSTLGLLLATGVGIAAVRMRRRNVTTIAAMLLAAGVVFLASAQTQADVIAARVSATGTDNASTVATVTHQTPGAPLYVATDSPGSMPGGPYVGNYGDLTLRVGQPTLAEGGTSLMQADGVIFATVNQFQYASVSNRNMIETPGELTSSTSGYSEHGFFFSTYDVGGGGREANFNFAMTYFPFADGWIAGHVAADGTYLGGNTSDVTVTTSFDAPFSAGGHFKLSIDGVDSQDQGMLFAISQENTNSSGNVVPVGKFPDGSGWDIRINDQGQDFPATESNADWAFVYLPYGGTRNLVAGGEISVPLNTTGDASVLSGIGNFTIERVDLGTNDSITPPGAPDGALDHGRILLKIPGKDDTTGMLMVGTSKWATNNNTTFAADDNFMAWEYDAGLGGFLIESYDLAGATLQGSDFYFAYFDYANPIELGESLLKIVVDRDDGTITLENNTGADVGFDYYQIDSAAGSLNEGGWNSLDEQDFGAIGTGIGESFDEAGGSNNSSLAEVFLKTESGFPELGDGATPINLGTAYNHLMNAEDLVFQYRQSNGYIIRGLVEYIGDAPGLDGDYNNDGMVDARDYVVWRDQMSNNAAAYATWRQNFGGGGMGSGSTQAAVPEPTGFALVACGLVALLAAPRTRRKRAA